MGLGSSRYSPALVAGAVRLGRAMPFAKAAQILALFTGVPISAATVRRLTVDAGQALWEQEQTRSAALWAGITLPADATDRPLQLSIDGSMVPVRGEGWREVKVLAIGERTETGMEAMSYAAVLGDAERFGDLVVGELADRGVLAATDVVAVNDGAVWIQGILDLHCPQAARVLDVMHAAGYLAAAATESLDTDAAAMAWFATERDRLREGDPEEVLAALASLPPSSARDTALGYLGSRREQIQYRRFRERGWPIGSGCVESAHKRLVQSRMTGPGMRWGAQNVDAMLALQVMDANDRWAAQWPTVIVHQRAVRQTRRREAASARAAARAATGARPSPPPLVAAETPRPSPPPPPKIVNGKPTATHPWRTYRHET